jgi:hypothetical protein
MNRISKGALNICSMQQVIGWWDHLDETISPSGMSNRKPIPGRNLQITSENKNTE